MIDKKVIEQCLNDHDFKPSSAENEKASWVLQANIRGMPFVVVQPKDKDFVLIQRVLEIAEEEVKRLREIDERERHVFLNQLKRDLLLVETRYSMDFEDEEKSILTRLTLTTFIYEDGFSKDRLVQKLFAFHDASLLLAVNLRDSRIR